MWFILIPADQLNPFTTVHAGHVHTLHYSHPTTQHNEPIVSMTTRSLRYTDTRSRLAFNQAAFMLAASQFYRYRTRLFPVISDILTLAYFDHIFLSPAMSN